MRTKICAVLRAGSREGSRFAGTPTEETHGDRYGAAIGPFRTLREARLVASDEAVGNPHPAAAADADRIAAKEGAR